MANTKKQPSTASINKKKSGLEAKVSRHLTNTVLASTTLKVTVNGGIPPFSIQVNFFKDGEFVSRFSSSTSFTHLFSDLSDGEYDITVGGFNPAGGNTVLDLSQDEIKLAPTSAPSPVTKTGVSYNVDFNFKVPK